MVTLSERRILDDHPVLKHEVPFLRQLVVGDEGLRNEFFCMSVNKAESYRAISLVEIVVDRVNVST